MKTPFIQLVCALALVAGVQACSSGEGDSQPRTDQTEHDNPGEKPRVEPVILGGYDFSFPEDTTWFALTAERCLFYTYVAERGDYRARVFDDKGEVIKVVYESGLKKGINEIAFNPQAMEVGTYSYLLTKNIYADTVQLCHFEIQEVPSMDVSGD